MTQVLPWRSGADARALVRHAARALAAGRLVAFPTETVYGLAASALAVEGVSRLVHGKGRSAGKPLTLAIGSAAEALDWVPEISALGRRLARRCWPGPVTLVFDDGIESGLASRLPESVRDTICPTGSLGLRVPAHSAILQVLRTLPGPLVLTSANTSGAEPAVSADQVAQLAPALGEDLALIVNDGPCHYGQASTVVKVKRDCFEVLREGVVTAPELERLSLCVILFVCTGNTCRSPLAEALCKKMLADRLGCPVGDLPQRGFMVLSAGLAAMMGAGAAEEAIEVAREMGADLTQHGSRPLSAELAGQADYIFAMTRGHLQAIADQISQIARVARVGDRGQLGVVPRLLCGEGYDIADPIGCSREVYRECAQQIARSLEGLLPELRP
jgi:protein-tyrosine phosphatase